MSDAEHVDGAGTVVGDVLDGYTITRRIRVRGCNAVYQAVKDGRVVALKTLCRGAVPRDHSRVDNELASLRRLERCPATPSLLATGTSGPQRYFAMTWRPGRSLRRHAESADGEAAEVFADLAVAICRAYDALHRGGVAHGDVSRHNILIDAKRGVGLVDFESSARTSGPDGEVRRRFTWAYAAPEFAADATTPARQLPTPASDQYAVAAVLYRQLTGRHPRPTTTDVKLDSPRALRARARRLTGEPARRWPRLPDVFAKALRLRPSSRFGSMAEFADALARSSGPSPDREWNGIGGPRG